MATQRMLIDATHREETRVVVLHEDRLKEYDLEVATRKQLKGNIYLAKVTRVEPSLQAAFIEYGGNRHGFLSFSEIHPDYYQIPVADREVVLAEHDAAEKVDDDAETGADDGEGEGSPSDVEVVGGDDTEEVDVRRRKASPRRYRIQEVIKARQILLVQVVKEERGNKGAALTTYLSLAGRYSVLMPNTARGGGISRKINNGATRRRLKSILGDLDIPDGMGVIVRTAGEERNKAEIKRDYDYLLRLWSSVRDLTLKSSAPTMVYEEANLIKRTIRDVYSRDIDEIIIDGEEACQTAKAFMKLLMPSHVKRIKPWPAGNSPLFRHYKVEDQLDAMHGSDVQLKSGGYIIINPTEALVSIDVNSGRSTRERNIEATALKTNIEAADEVARQLRLRDLAGLVVIDFIDMENTRNQIQVERRLKDAMRQDRARIQLGRISPFGLMELSRQRLRPSLFETSFGPCPHCSGSGFRRSTESTALHILRAIEEEGLRRSKSSLVVHVPVTVALYILNAKRPAVAELESRYELTVTFAGDDSLIPPQHRIERENGPSSGQGEADKTTDEQASGDQDGKRRRRRKPRRRGRSEDGGEAATETATDAASTDASTEPETTAEETPATEAKAGGEEGRAKRRRRGRRGGRRRQKTVADQGENREAGEETNETASESAVTQAAPDPATIDPAPTAVETAPETPSEGDAEPKAKKPRRRRAARPSTNKDEPKVGRAASKAGIEERLPVEEKTDEPSTGDATTPTDRIQTEIQHPEPAPVITVVASSKSAGESPETDKPSETQVESVVSGNKAAGTGRSGWWKRLTE
jgi:ribonuclease E